MKKSALILFLTLLPFMAKAQNTQNSEDGKKIDKEKLESKDYLPEIHGTIRGKYEYQTTMGAGRFEVRNARVSVTGNVLPIVAYKAEIDLSDEGSIKMLDAYARLFPAKGLTVTADEETSALVTTDYKRQRLTGGITFSLSKAFRTDLRLNYEKYFYANSSIAKESEQDKIVLELMVRF